MSAQARLSKLRAALLEGDESITAIDLAEAHAAIEREELLAEAARRKATDPEELKRQARIEAGERKRRRQAEEARAVRLRGEQRAIESGLAEATLRDLPHSPDAARKLRAIEAWRESGASEWPGYDAVEVPA